VRALSGFGGSGGSGGRPRHGLSSRLRSLVVASLLGGLTCAALVPSVGCIQLGKRDAAKAVPMGSWTEWQDLSPLLELAEAHVDEATFAILERAGEQLREGAPRAADATLAVANRGGGRHWVAVARGNLAALYFSKCIRGVAWRLPEDLNQDGLQREIDYGPDTRIEAGDLSVEALLTNLDDAVAAGKTLPTLRTQAQIARVRVAGFAVSCPANEEVERRAAAVMNSDLATLAAEEHLTPDLAYMWASVQLQTYSGSAARPFLLQALDGGFDDPAVTYMLAAVAYEQGDYDEADVLAKDAGERYTALGDVGQGGQCVFMRGEIARAAERWPDARTHYKRVLEGVPAHAGAMFGLAGAALGERSQGAAASVLNTQIRILTRGEEELDEPAALEIVDAMEELAIIANADTLEMVQVTREALLLDIEAEPDPFRRGLRYFYTATLEVRLGDYDSARGHAVTAGLEFDDSWVGIPDKANPRDFLDRLEGGS